MVIKKGRRKRRMWSKPWLLRREEEKEECGQNILRREEKSAYGNILAELRLEDPQHYRKYIEYNYL